jgi:hypothetical protein
LTAHDDTTPAGDWAGGAGPAFARERALDDTIADPRSMGVLDGAARDAEQMLDSGGVDLRVIRSRALLSVLAGRSDPLPDGEIARRVSVVLLADPDEPGTPHRCCRCGATYRLDGADWMSAGREDACCLDCTRSVAAEAERRAADAECERQLAITRASVERQRVITLRAPEPEPLELRPARKPKALPAARRTPKRPADE